MACGAQAVKKGAGHASAHVQMRHSDAPKKKAGNARFLRSQSLCSAVGDVHRDFKAKTQIDSLRGLPVHVNLLSVLLRTTATRCAWIE
jgi:hypothetical protein